MYKGDGGVEEQGVADFRPSTVCPEKLEGAEDYIPPALRNAGRGPSRSAAVSIIEFLTRGEAQQEECRSALLD